MKNIPQDMLHGTIHTTSKYGNFEIINYKRNNNVLVRFIDTGYETITQSSHIRRDGVKDLMAPSVFGVGFFGVGPHKAKPCGKSVKSYVIWQSMIGRCYDESIQDKNPTYKGCAVCDTWHNYQNFAEWFNENYIDGYELDKDIKIKGNRVYSPEACMLVPKQASQAQQRQLAKRPPP